MTSVPAWLRPLAAAALEVRPEQLSRFLPPEHGGRQSAVLMLFGDRSAEPAPSASAAVPDTADVLLIERSRGLRSHAGQVAFPGGAIDPGDDGPVGAALREAAEETGLDPAGVEVLGTLPALFLPVSDFVVTPVLGWWREPSPVRVLDPGEVAKVRRVRLAALLDPANRFRVRHPSGHVGPAFRADGLLVWGFTGGLLDRLLRLAGWERPWDTRRYEDLPDDLAARPDPRAAPAPPAAGEIG